MIKVDSCREKACSDPQVPNTGRHVLEKIIKKTTQNRVQDVVHFFPPRVAQRLVLEGRSTLFRCWKSLWLMMEEIRIDLGCGPNMNQI